MGPSSSSRARGACLLGVDVGTYSSKGVLVSESGTVLAERAVDHTLQMPAPGRFEQDPEEVWWKDFTTICRYLLEASGVRPARIAGVGISTISPAVVPLDRAGAPLRPAILYGIDTRAAEEAARLGRLTGASLSSQSASPKVMWIRRNEPEVWARTRSIVNGSGYLNRRLTGEATIDVYDAAIFAPFFDLPSLSWSKELEEEVAPVEMMPRPTWTCEIAGRVSEQAAGETGLAPGTPVITGTADAAAEAVGAGLAEPGDLMMMYGSSTFFILKVPEPLSPRSFWGSPFLDERSHVVTGGTVAAGSLTRWFRDQFGQPELEAQRRGEGDAYEALAALAAGSPPGARGLIVLPYFSGERTPLSDPDARGLVTGLTLRHTRADLYRALLESVGYAIRHNIEVMAQEGCRAARILAVGGGTRNPLWLQIVSNIAGVDQQVPEPQTGACYGDAFLAGVGAGLFQDLREISRWVRGGKAIRPRPRERELYEPGYRLYRELYVRNAEIMHRMSALNR